MRPGLSGFPAKVLVLAERGLKVRAEKEHLVLERGGKTLRDVPLDGLGEIICVGRVDFTGSAVFRCLKHEVLISFFSGLGRFVGRISGPSVRNGKLRLKQFQTATDKERALALAKGFVEAKILNQRRVLLDRQRQIKDPDVALALAKLRHALAELRDAKSVDEVRGIEGSAAAVYFGVFGRLISNKLFGFRGRTKRPPRDPVNAMLSFGYTVVGALVEADVEAAGLDPAIGCLHAPEYGRPSLALDILEQFRPVLVDRLVLALVNRRQVTPADFGPPPGEDEEEEEQLGGFGEGYDSVVPEAVIPALAERDGAGSAKDADDRGETRNLKGAVYLNTAGRKVFLSSLLGRLRERVYYPDLDGSYQYRAIVRSEVYKVARAFVDEHYDYRGFVLGAR